LRTTPGLPAVVKVSWKKIGVIWALLGVLEAVVFWGTGWWASFIFLGVMLPLAVLFYSGVSRESSVSVARGRVFVHPRTIGNKTTALSESICKPEAIKEEGDAVLVFSRWSQLRIVFQNETERTSFISEVSGLLKR
jgi:hypothetical protein